MKKLKPEEIGYSISGAILFALTIGAMFESVFHVKGNDLYASVILAAIGYFVYMIYMNMVGDD